VKAFDSVLTGRRYFSKPLPENAPAPADTRHLSLSAREHDVLLAFAAGKRTGEIATDFNLSTKTVSTYKRRIIDKLHQKSTADLVRYVIDHRLS
jgi:DNA-binding NarL/FixJ family response regulator